MIVHMSSIDKQIRTYACIDVLLYNLLSSLIKIKKIEGLSPLKMKVIINNSSE